MLQASTSRGNHVTWCFRSLALKNPGKLSFRETYSVAPISRFFTEPSVAIHNKFDLHGRVMDLRDDSAVCASRKDFIVLSVDTILSEEFFPATLSSKVAIIWEHIGSTRPRTVYAPKKRP